MPEVSIPKGQAWFIKRSQKLGYISAPEGVCFGFAYMAMQAFFAKKLDNFTDRLSLIASIPLDNFARELEEKKAQWINNQITLKEYKQYVAIYAFFDGIEVFHQRKLYPQLVEKNQHFSSQKPDLGLVLAKPVKLNNTNIVPCGKLTGSYTLVELKEYFTTLKSQLRTCNQPVSMILTANKHGICVCYDPTENTWILIDANSGKPKAIKGNEDIAKAVMGAFFSKKISLESHKRVLFATEFYATENNQPDVSNAVERFKTHEIHTITDEKRDSHDIWGANLLYTAARTGDNATVQTLMQSMGKEINKNIKKIGCNALHIAALNGQPECCKTLLTHKKINLNATTDSGDTFLTLAVRNEDNEQFVEILEKAGLLKDFLSKNSKIDPSFFRMAIKHGRIQFLTRFLQNFTENEKNALLNKQRHEYEKVLLQEDKQLDDDDEKQVVFGAPNQTQDDSEEDEYEYLHKKTPLELAAKHGQVDVVVLLLENGAELSENFVDIALENNQFALLRDEKLKKYPGIQKYLEAIDSQEFTRKELTNAVRTGDIERVSQLLDNDPNLRFIKDDQNERTLLHLAVKFNHPEIAKLLLNIPDERQLRHFLASQDDKENTALHVGAKVGAHECVEIILQKSQNNKLVSTANEYGQTALHVASEHGHAGVINALLQRPNKEALIERTDSSGNLALHYASIEGNLTAFQTLMAHGAYFLAENDYTDTPLSLAVENGHAEIVEILLRETADHPEVKLQFKDTTPFIFTAAELGEIDTVRVLLADRRTDINATADLHGEKTALYIAAKNGHEDVVRLLIQNNANVGLALLNLNEADPIHVLIDSIYSEAFPEGVHEDNQQQVNRVVPENNHQQMNRVVPEDNQQHAEIIAPENGIQHQKPTRNPFKRILQYINERPVLKRALLGFAIFLGISVIILTVVGIIIGTGGIGAVPLLGGLLATAAASAANTAIATVIVISAIAFISGVGAALFGFIEYLKLKFKPEENPGDQLIINEPENDALRGSYASIGDHLEADNQINPRRNIQESDSSDNDALRGNDASIGDHLKADNPRRNIQESHSSDEDESHQMGSKSII